MSDTTTALYAELIAQHVFAPLDVHLAETLARLTGDSSPMFEDEIKDGRLLVQPFDVKLGPTTMKVAGSNGIDQSLQYTLGLRVPSSLLGGGASQAISGLVSKAGKAGVDLSAAPEIPLAIQLGGTVTNPSVKADVGNLAASVASRWC